VSYCLAIDSDVTAIGSAAIPAVVAFDERIQAEGLAEVNQTSPLFAAKRSLHFGVVLAEPSLCSLGHMRSCAEFLGRRPLLAVVEKSADAEQKRGNRISFPTEIEKPYATENAYHDDGYNFEHGVGTSAFSGSRAERLAETASSQTRRRPIASRARQA
jgi:hypothetical protein